MSRIDNWSIVNRFGEYVAITTHECKRYIQGEIYGDSRFLDGSRVSTSSIQEVNLEDNIVRTRNTEYKLDNMSDKYSIWIDLSKI